MAPVATETNGTTTTNGVSKAPVKANVLFNPFYSPDTTGDVNDTDYKYAKYKPRFPDVHWEPLDGNLPVTDRAQFADPEKKALFAAASKIQHLTPAIGTELSGIDLRQLTNAQKDELALLVAERGVVFFRDQEITIEEQLELARHFGPLHKHATTPVPRQPGLEEVHIVYNDGTRRPDPSAFSKIELWHSDVSYELQPPSTTSLKLITGPPYGGDTLWSSGYALYSSFSPGFQKYLEGLTAVHSAVAQADGARAAGLTVRREPVESVHPVVRVHPVTGYKSIYVNPGFTRRIVGLPKAESDAILQLLFSQIADNPDFQVRFHWEVNSIAFWDNRIVTHSATFDFFPHVRHALRATPHGERPTAVADYEAATGKAARLRDEWARLGVAPGEPEPSAAAAGRPVRGYND
ncbi:alpha-ketoglutarate-dependent sulfonate dioxygenase [Epithele typhae]|uniref:alpha-ketoglutarate-dependent sulfonate dioxygenase n=1 Tax=Epithele typhae TaxID=378194 RepID=UPI0020080DDD|nr:alpha-ketoglutarate-dependent sulfonate dioxygenase [Epithele typhae]KAH9945087.1 alpha-ketoglutarate-dependent sulfonate dioxygenase [Epithele typhae]